MKYYSVFILILLSSIVSQPIFTQSVIQFGIKAGVSSTYIESENQKNNFYFWLSKHYSMQIVNPTVSIFINNRSLKYFHSIAEIQFMRMGGLNIETLPVSTAEYPDGNGTFLEIRSEVSIQSINLALGVEPTIEIANIEMYSRLTPTLSYLLSVNNFFPLTDNYNRTLLGYQVGGGIRLPWMADVSIIFEILYARHIEPFYATSQNGNYHTKGWLSTIGVTF